MSAESRRIPDIVVPVELEGLLEGVRKLQSRLPEFSRRVAELSGTGCSSDGLVTVQVNSRGGVVSVEVSSRGYAEKATEVLAFDIVSATNAARLDVERKFDEIVQDDPTGMLSASLKGEFKIPDVAEAALARIQARLYSDGRR